MNTTQILDRLQGVTRNGDGWKARCPAHDDQTPSLSITEGDDGRTLLKCHAGCTVENICAGIGITPADLFAECEKSDRRIVATYDYHDRNGKLAFQVIRYEPKNFRQRRPDATAIEGWTWKTKGVEKESKLRSPLCRSRRWLNSLNCCCCRFRSLQKELHRAS